MFNMFGSSWVCVVLALCSRRSFCQPKRKITKYIKYCQLTPNIEKSSNQECCQICPAATCQDLIAEVYLLPYQIIGAWARKIIHFS